MFTMVSPYLAFCASTTRNFFLLGLFTFLTVLVAVDVFGIDQGIFTSIRVTTALVAAIFVLINWTIELKLSSLR